MQQILVVSFANYILVKINLSGKTIKIFWQLKQQNTHTQTPLQTYTADGLLSIT